MEAMIPLSPYRKRMLVAIRPDNSDTIRVVIKGAPENIMPMCTSKLD